MLPEGANSVVMLEYTENISSSMIEISRSVAPRENMLREDEDIKNNEKVLEKGHYLRPQDVGLLAALGWQKINVFKKPKVAIISTGDEIVPINQKPEPGQVRNINTFMLGAAVEQIGCIPYYSRIIKDNEKILKNELQKFMENPEIDLVLISGGSSVGVRDYTFMISSLATADGYITIRLNQEGLYQGEKVTVTLFE